MTEHELLHVPILRIRLWWNVHNYAIRIAGLRFKMPVIGSGQSAKTLQYAQSEPKSPNS